MAATYCTAATLKASLGVGTLYDAYDWIEVTCQTAEDLINQFLNFDSAPIVGVSISSNVATIGLANPGIFSYNQVVTVSGAGATYNGSRTITGTIPWTSGSAVTMVNYYNFPYTNFPRGYSFIQCAITAPDDYWHLIQPYGLMLGADTKTLTYANTAAIQTAALILAENIWQSRMSTQNGGMSVDGYSSSPFRMSNTLMASIRGLLAPYLSPAGMLG